MRAAATRGCGRAWRRWAGAGRRGRASGRAAAAPPTHGHWVGSPSPASAREACACDHCGVVGDGILEGYMQDRLNGRLMGAAPAGNGRRESFAHAPIPRMTNTYMLAGTHDPQEIMRSVKRGLYAVNFGGGSVDITSGKFVFSASEAYLIEAGKIGPAVKGPTLIRNGPDAMTKTPTIG